MNDLEKMFAYVEEHFDKMKEELGNVCSFRSVAGDEEGLEKTRQYILDKWKSIGLSAVREEIPGGNAVLYSENPGESKKTILLYNHYDVVNEGKWEKWTNKNPYDVANINGKLYGRGISDNKGGLFSRIHALEAIKKVRGQLPVGVKFFVEGDEETASPSMKKLAEDRMDRYKEMTKADLCIWEGGVTDEEGRPWIRFGVRGYAAFELSVKTSNIDCHGRMGAVVPNAAWRLIWALASMKDANEKVLIEGFYDDIVPMTEKDRTVLHEFPYDEQKLKTKMGFDQYLLGATGDDLKERLYMEPCMSVCGLEAGEMYNGPRGIVPHKATARVSFYLIANQDAEKLYRQIRTHLDRHGFPDVEVEFLGGEGAARTSVDIPERKQLEEAAKLVYGKPMVLEITQMGAGPAVCFRKAWKDLPIISAGVANNGSNHHAPDENINIADYKNAVKYMIALLCSFADENKL